MSSFGTSCCRLPLLDGESKTTSQLIAVELTSGKLETLHQLYQQDRAVAADLLYTAWALVLRCYTGQDEILFHIGHTIGIDLEQPAAGHQSLFQLVFKGNELLTACLARATASRPPNEPSLESPASPNKPTDPRQRRANTAVWIEDGTSDSFTKKDRVQSTRSNDSEVSNSHSVVQSVLTTAPG